MEHAKAIVIKGSMIFAVLLLIFGSYTGLGEIFLLTIVLVAASYFAGDLFILPKTSNLAATFADLLLSFLVIWGMGLMLFEHPGNLIGAALFASLLIAAGEWFFHSYIADKVLRINRKI